LTILCILTILVTMERVRAVLRRILRETPSSMRRLADKSGLTHGALVRARDGDIRLSPDSVRRIANALREWSATCADLADRLEAALAKDQSVRKGGDGGEPTEEEA